MPDKINPKVSVICAAYNEERNFEKHLQHLVNQTYKNKEIIIVDDGSTDKTGEIGRKFSKKYKFVTYFCIKHLDGYGCVRPRLEAIKHATGDVLCIVDADGYYEKNNIKYGIKKLFSSKEIAAVVPRMNAWDPDNFVAKYRAMVYESRFIDPELINQGAAEGKYSPWLLKKEIYDEVGGYNIKDAYCEDLKLAVKILNLGYKIVHEPKCNWYHRLGDNPFSIVKKNFNIGRMHSTEGKFNLTNFVKIGYFTISLILFILGFFNYKFFLIFLLYLLPMFINGFLIFLKVKHNKLKWNAFYSPVVAYLVNIPYVLGFYIGMIVPYKK